MKYTVAKILSTPPRYAAIDYDCGQIVAESESLEDLHNFCHAHGLVYEEL